MWFLRHFCFLLQISLYTLWSLVWSSEALPVVSLNISKVQIPHVHCSCSTHVTSRSSPNWHLYIICPFPLHYIAKYMSNNPIIHAYSYLYIDFYDRDMVVLLLFVSAFRDLILTFTCNISMIRNSIFNDLCYLYDCILISIFLIASLIYRICIWM